MIIIEIINLNRENKVPELETILIAGLKDTFIKYEKKLHQSLITNNFELYEEYLTNFCFDLLELSENEQVYIARIFFSGIVTDIMKKQALKNQLHPKVLSHVFSTIDRIDKLENITEFVLDIPYLVKYIQQYIVNDCSYIGTNSYVEEILNLIESHLKDDFLTVEWVAQKVDLSVTHINNLFKEHIDQTIGEYISERRIKEISFELITTSKPIKDIYKSYSFINQSHFTQRFKQIKGMTPLQYRKTYFKH